MDQDRSKDRIRWHCRRGLLELDLILNRFVERHLDELDNEQRALFPELLSYDDITLMRIVSGREECDDSRLKGLIDMLRTP